MKEKIEDTKGIIKNCKFKDRKYKVKKKWTNDQQNTAQKTKIDSANPTKTHW